ncbi:MAG: alpha/beta hydrolase [Gemmiger sp.]|nr:alpha/beta hydrolase [Gemmiger sp.]
MRLYEKTLVAEIRNRQYDKTVDGVQVLFKPVPDAEPAHLDPRLLRVIQEKQKLFAGRAKRGWCLSGERYRPDKITYDLTETPVDCEERLISIQGNHKIDLYIYRAQNAAAGCPILVYLHGGGFTAGDIHLFGCQMKLIAEQSGAVVLFPEYRLAPENPFPAAIEDGWGTVEWAYKNAAALGADPAKLMVAGDSAGGSLTNACVLQDTAGIIKKIMGIYPAWDMSDYRTQAAYTWCYDAYDIVEEEKALAYSRIDRIKSGIENDPESSNSLYLQGKTSTKDPLVSALFAGDEALKRFPETIIVSAEYDYLRPSSEYAAKKLQSLGVPVRSIRYCGCDHGFLDMLGTIVQSEELCLTIADELKKCKAADRA